MPTLYLLAVPLLLAVAVIRAILRRIHTSSISHLPGPLPGPWLVGNLPALMRPKEVGDAEFQWTQEFGNSCCFKGTFGTNVLFTADAKALQYIFNTSGYNFPKPPETRAISALTTGRGIGWAEGHQHARQRKIMNPAFSYSSLRIFLPLFRNTAQRTVVQLKDKVAESGGTSAVVDIPGWLSRTTLDAIGAAAFDYQFGSIEQGLENKLAKAFSGLLADAFLDRPDFTIAFESLWGVFPDWLLTLVQNIPTKQLKRLKDYMTVARGVAQTLVDRQVASHGTDSKEGSKDVMSILIRANMSEDPKTKLSEDEILSQLTTLFLAGHDTTGSSITWSLYELSRDLKFQQKVREEIQATRVHAAQRGYSELTIADLDSMKHLLALVKETLRFHPIVNALIRVAGRDDVIPLATPQKTKTGETVTSIPVSKGQRVFISIAAYNRLKSVWGEDADQWRPERFLEEIESSQKTGLGVIGNIATFSSGLRSCIGWRFALIEMQAILIEFLEHFEFSPAPGNFEIIRGPTGIMTPMIKGSNTRRTELPITITPI